MPIRNTGTVLENIVLVEAARFAFESSIDPASPFEFINGFAMPPLSEWRDPDSDRCMNPERINKLLEFRQNDIDYTGLLHACIQLDSGSGPSGALLIALLARRMNKALRLWLNDIVDGEHYPGTVPELRRFVATLNRIEPKGGDPVDVAVCDQPFPQSLDDLRRTLARWGASGTPTSRIAFLDPNRYRINCLGGARPETCSEDHRLWLDSATSGDCPLAIAIHFTGHRSWKTLRLEIVQLRRDAEQAGYQSSVTFSHGYYTTTVSVKSLDGRAEATTNTLQEAVKGAWERWFWNTGGGKYTLGVDAVLSRSHVP